VLVGTMVVGADDVLFVLVGVLALLFVFVGLFVVGLAPRGVDEADATNSAGVDSGMGVPYSIYILVQTNVRI